MPEQLPQQKPNEDSPSTEKKKTNKKWFVLLFILILLLAVGMVTFLVSSKDEYKAEEPEKTATPSAKTKIQEQEPERECDGQVYENERQGYRICFESGWVKREFDPPSITVGFDPNNIPEASEYFGLIAVSISNSDIDDAVSSVEDSLESSSISTTIVDGVFATQVSGTVPVNLVNTGGPTIRTFFTHFDRLYSVTLTTDNTENRQFYDDFLESWQFLDSASEPPPE